MESFQQGDAWWHLRDDGKIFKLDPTRQEWMEWSEGSSLGSPPPHFLLDFSPDHKRAVVRRLAGREKKYARAFSRGDLAVLSVFGTESWTDYAQVVLQIMMVDSMAALEQKIDKLTAQLSKLEGLVDPTPPPPAPTP